MLKILLANNRRKSKILKRVDVYLNHIKMNDLEKLKKDLEVISLEERLEMVQLFAADGPQSPNGNTSCCFSSGH